MKRTDWRKPLRSLSIAPFILILFIVWVALFSGNRDVGFDVYDDQIEVAEIETPEKPEVGDSEVPPLVEFEDIAEKNVFSSSRERPSVRYSPEGRARGSTTVSGDYVLLGVVVSGNETSTAVIRKGGQGSDAEAYKLGDDIDNMVVEEIFYDRVILRQGEKETILELKPREDEKKRRPAKLQPSPKSRTRTRPPARKDAD